MSNTYRINEFAKKLGRSVQTIRRWEVEGKLIAKRLPSGHRYFDESDVRMIMGGGTPPKRCVIVYCRVSSAGQKDDLASQVSAMETFCLGSGVVVDEWVTEIGGGMNFKRKGFWRTRQRLSGVSIKNSPKNYPTFTSSTLRTRRQMRRSWLLLPNVGSRTSIQN